MSSKVTIKSRQRTPNSPGYRLYDDVLDDLGAQSSDDLAQVYLELDGVNLQLETLNEGGARVTLTLPKALARELGLLTPSQKTNKGGL